MSNTVANLRRKIVGANDLQSVVRTMKAVAASSVGQYENCIHALSDYFRTVELGLSVCFRHGGQASTPQPSWAQFKQPSAERVIRAIIFGTDQGLVGRFNDVIADYAISKLKLLPGRIEISAVGERLQQLLTDSGHSLLGVFPLPNSVKSITPLIGRILLENESLAKRDDDTELHLFYNRSVLGSVYEPFCQRLLPLDATWSRDLAKRPWPTLNQPEVLAGSSATLRAFIREYLFVSVFRACAESMASENTSRLAAMQRADRNIDELLGVLNGNYHRLRQNSIDEELFDVVSGFEALTADSLRIYESRNQGIVTQD